MKEFKNLCDLPSHGTYIGSINSENEILLYLEKNLGYDISNIKVAIYSQEQLVSGDDFVLETDFNIYQLILDGKYVEFKEILEENGIPLISIGALKNGGRAHSASYYAQQIGKDNPEQYDNLDENSEVAFQLLCEFLEFKASEYLKQYPFIRINVIK